jgi:hypothetical protein
MRLKLIAIAILAFAGTVSAQEPWAQRPDERQEVVLNEDGGRAFIVRPSSTTFNRVIKPGGPIIQDLQQYSVFLGSG